VHLLQERGTVEALTPGDDGARRARRRLLVIVAVTIVLVIVADQVTKSIAVATLASGPVHLIGPFSFELEYNTGVAFSVGVGTVPFVIEAVVLVIIVTSVVVFARHITSVPSAIGIGMVLGGALGNLSDRLFRHHGGGVVDFVHSTFWPTFNVADSCIVVGGILLAVRLVFFAPKRDAVPAGS
jgi:signal peptidase II